MAIAVERVPLRPETLQSFNAYILAAEQAMQRTEMDPGEFLWSAANADRVQQLRKGTIVADYAGEGSKEPSTVPHGLIHDWMGAVFIPDGTLQQIISVMQDYENHKDIYRPDVAGSGVVSHAGDDFHIYLRLVKKKIITVVLDTFHDVHYSFPAPNQASCRSHTTEILEIEHAGTPQETKSPPDTGYGFLWRLNSYWRIEEMTGGAYVDCRAISLTRDIPSALAWVLNPAVRNLPKQSLINTLAATRKAVATMVTVHPQP